MLQLRDGITNVQLSAMVSAENVNSLFSIFLTNNIHERVTAMFINVTYVIDC